MRFVLVIAVLVLSLLFGCAMKPGAPSGPANVSKLPTASIYEIVPRQTGDFPERFSHYVPMDLNVGCGGDGVMASDFDNNTTLGTIYAHACEYSTIDEAKAGFQKLSGKTLPVVAGYNPEFFKPDYQPKRSLGDEWQITFYNDTFRSLHPVTVVVYARTSNYLVMVKNTKNNANQSAYSGLADEAVQVANLMIGKIK